MAVTGLTGVTAVSGGGSHTCAVLTDGTARCWGENVFGQLGNGTTTTSTTPVPVTGLTGVVAISAGWQHTCALLGSGAIQCWGQGQFGKLGNGSTTNRTTPVAVSGIAGAVGVTAGWWHHSCALLNGGAVKCWGANQWGQFGNGTVANSSTPITMTGPGVVWESSNTGVATINGSGLASGLNAGTTTITATDSSGASASTTLTVAAQTGTFTLSVNRAGTGTGSVSSNPPGINCGADCSEPYGSGTSVTLTATASGGSTFAGWSGCNTVSGATCTVTMTAAKTVTASFDPPRFVLTVAKTGSGSGTVSSSPSGIKLRRGLFRAVRQRHQRDADGERRRRIHVRQLERVQHGFRRHVYGGRERGDHGHRDVQPGGRRRDADGRVRRRRVHVRRPLRRDGEVHGAQPVRTAWRRLLDGLDGCSFP